MGGRLDHDRYRDWRLDVDNMSYEQLLELGEKIGNVSTGLRKDQIRRCVKKTKLPMKEMIQWKCTICQVFLMSKLPFSNNYKIYG
ncbi:hypothetical protein Hdeb2414_s0008g00291321 [Helianthus debilis subsp. tardiflorus]